jgi:hypothetical protein
VSVPHIDRTRSFDRNSCSISSIFMSKNTDIVRANSAQADINIFTVASGLLYEVSGNSLLH